MPSFQDTAVIFLIALLLFGPKELPKLARYLGKLMGEFRRASSEFRMQMDDEFRAIEQAEQQKKIAAIEAAAPVTPLNIPEPEHPHMPAAAPETPAAETAIVTQIEPQNVAEATEDSAAPAQPLPIASNGDLHLMPPATGLPVARSTATASSSLAPVFDAIPHTPEPEASNHG